jgi:transcriptional regulator GlxA family with amidase domain
MLEVTVVLLEGGYPSTAIGPIEAFSSAGVLWNWLHGETQKPRFRVRTASIDGGPATTIAGLKLVPEFAIADIKRSDIVIIPASAWDIHLRIAKETPLIPWLRRQHARGAYIAGVCSGVAFLAEAGLIDGLEATTHWALAETLAARYPAVKWRAEQFVTEDAGVFCSGGVYASIDLSLYMIERFCGREIAIQCARSLLVNMPRGRQSGYSVLAVSRPHGDEQIRKAEEYLQQHFHQTVPIDEISGRLGMSTRNFIRRFKAATGRLPGAYVQALRVSSAREILEQDDVPIQKVCEKIGYDDVAFFRSLFKRHTGMTPGEYRMRFAQAAFERRLTAPRRAGF